FRQRCSGLFARAKEFFHDDQDSTSIVFERTADSSQIPDFIEYLYCRLIQDRLSGLILFGVSSEAGAHEEINQQEHAFRDQSAELVEALSSKYPQSPDFVINHFNLKLCATPPLLPGNESKNVFTGYQRLVGTLGDNEKRARIETQFFGPTL